MALIDEIRKRLAAKPAEAAPDAQAQLTKLAVAKTGKAGGGGAPAASAIGQSVAAAEGAAAAQAADTQTSLAVEGLATKARGLDLAQEAGQAKLLAQAKGVEEGLVTQAQAAGTQRAGAEAAQRAGLAAKERMTTADLVAKYQTFEADSKAKFDDTIAALNQQRTQGRSQLASDRKAADMHQAVQDLAFANQAYVDRITAIGDERRFHEAENFNLEMLNFAFGEETVRVADNFGFKNLLDASDREFNEMIGSIDASTAMSLAASQASSVQTAAMYQAGGDLIEGGAKAYASRDKEDTKGKAP